MMATFGGEATPRYHRRLPEGKISKTEYSEFAARCVTPFIPSVVTSYFSNQSGERKSVILLKVIHIVDSFSTNSPLQYNLLALNELPLSNNQQLYQKAKLQSLVAHSQ